MSETKHTPGPWSVGKTKPSGDESCRMFFTAVNHGEAANPGNTVAWAFSASRGDAENAQANAALIAAAPDLLSEAELTVKDLEHMHWRITSGYAVDPAKVDAIMGRLRRAIARAEGEAGR